MPSNNRRDKSLFDRVIRMARPLADTEVTTYWGAPALKRKGRAFVCTTTHSSAEPNTVAVWLDPEQRDDLIAAEPETYYVKDHYVPYPIVLVRLAKVSDAALKDLLLGGWTYVGRTLRKPLTPVRARKSRSRQG